MIIILMIIIILLLLLLIMIIIIIIMSVPLLDVPSPDGAEGGLCTPSPPTKSLGFRGVDSSKLLILKGGNSHVR